MAPSLARSTFRAYLAAGTGAATSFVALLLAAQVGFLGAHNPFRSFGDSDVRAAIVLSLICATLASLGAIVLAIPAAYLLARSRARGLLLVDALLDVPTVISPIVVGMSVMLLFQTKPGAWIEDNVTRFVFEVPGIVLVQFILALALQVRVLKAQFEGIDPRLEDVARFLGCTPWGAFVRITLPLARPGLVAAMVLGWCRALGDFGATVTIAGAVRGKTETIPVAIYLNLASVRLGKAVALTLVLTAIALGLLLLVKGVLQKRPA